jgi:hypothetical protein
MDNFLQVDEHAFGFSVREIGLATAVGRAENFQDASRIRPFAAEKMKEGELEFVEVEAQRHWASRTSVSSEQ